MLKKRIIPCLDIKNGRTVKGINFEQIRDAGDPVAVAKAYADQGADELVFLDIAATQEGRKTFAELVSEIAHVINIPFTVGGGITDIADVATLLEAGADKVSVNSAAVRNPHLISDLAKRFGSQCITVAVDTKAVDGVQQVFVSGGKVPTGIHTLDWVKQAESLGAGEILLTSIEHDGTKNGFAIALTRQIVEALQIPVIASGGAGKAAHFVDVFQQAQADAALAASIFHYGQIPIPTLKSYLKQQNIPIR